MIQRLVSRNQRALFLLVKLIYNINSCSISETIWKKTAEKCFKSLIIKTVIPTQKRVKNDDGKIIHLLWRYLNNKLAFSISNLFTVLPI